MAPVATAQSGRTINVLVGAGEDQLQLLAYFPQNLRIHQGDTVNFKLNGDELHTVSFTSGFDPGPAGVSSPLDPAGVRIPAFSVSSGGSPALNPQVAWPTRARGALVERYTGTGFISSGLFADEPLAPGTGLNETFQVQFPTAGTFSYICLVHPDRMRGSVEVVAASASVPDQTAVDTQASAEVAALTRVVNAAKAQGETPARRDSLANGSSNWYVRAGGQDNMSYDPRAQVLDFQPKNITIGSGDTVTWSSRYFHTVSFVPAPPSPEFFTEGAGGSPPAIMLDPVTVNAARPAATYDPTQYFNSGLLGQFGTIGDAWSLTFTQPGTFTYVCLIHDDVGMKGTITVQGGAGAAAPVVAAPVSVALPAQAVVDQSAAAPAVAVPAAGRVASNEDAVVQVVATRAAYEQAQAAFSQGDRTRALDLMNDAYANHFDPVERWIDQSISLEYRQEVEAAISRDLRRRLRDVAADAEIASQFPVAINRLLELDQRLSTR
jgi:plastocyanin